MGKDANGLDDGFGSDRDAVYLLDDVSQGKAEVGGAALVQREGVGVSIDGSLGEIVGLGDAIDAVPVQEFLLDELPLWVLANGALTLVSRKGGSGRFFVFPAAAGWVGCAAGPVFFTSHLTRR